MNDKKQRKNAFVSLFCIGLLAITLLSIINFQSVHASPQIINVPDDYTTIQDAINASSDGYIINIAEGTYYEHLILNKSISLRGAGSTLTIIDGSGIGDVVNVTNDNVNISGLAVRNASMVQGSGIILYGVKNCTIIGNTITQASIGINARFSENNCVSDNNLTVGTVIGIVDYHSHNNTNDGNTLSGSILGMYLDEARSNIISNNFIDASLIGIYLSFSDNNTMNQNQILNCTRNGIEYRYSNNNTISANAIDNCFNGTHMISSDDNLLIDNEITNCSLNGIWIYWVSKRNNVTGNCITNTNGPGIQIYYSDYNSIYGNNINSNIDGIALRTSCLLNCISMNDISSNSDGIEVIDSNSNSIYDNIIRDNDCGINISASYSNKFYHNNFISNIIQAKGSLCYNNWDKGYPTGGNYWSDYSGVDFMKGASQNESGSDGIGDTPYVIDSENIDRYPITTSMPIPEPSLFVLAVLAIGSLMFIRNNRKFQGRN